MFTSTACNNHCSMQAKMSPLAQNTSKEVPSLPIQKSRLSGGCTFHTRESHLEEAVQVYCWHRPRRRRSARWWWPGWGTASEEGWTCWRCRWWWLWTLLPGCWPGPAERWLAAATGWPWWAWSPCWSSQWCLRTHPPGNGKNQVHFIISCLR